VSPRQVEIPVGGRVTFVNNDTSFHEMASDPHPIHTDCPPMNEVGALAPGRSGQTGAFPTARTCGFHDHGQSSNQALQGTIVIR
jgi:plastocyanin